MEDDFSPKLLTVDVFHQSRPKGLDVLRHFSYLSRRELVHTVILHNCKKSKTKMRMKYIQSYREVQW